MCKTFYLFLFYTLYYPFRENRAASRGYGDSNRKSSATQSYTCMLGLFAFVMDYRIFNVRT